MNALSQPLFASLRGYDKAQLGPDLFSGVLIALLSIPISMGYAQLAGLPPDRHTVAAPLSECGREAARRLLAAIREKRSAKSLFLEARFR